MKILFLTYDLPYPLNTGGKIRAFHLIKGISSEHRITLFSYYRKNEQKKDLPEVKKGMPVRITLDAFPNESFAGQVRRIAPYVLEVEKQARTVDVEADFTNPADYSRLLAGYSADPSLECASGLAERAFTR